MRDTAERCNEISGQLGADAKRYQEKEVAQAIEAVQK